MIYTAKWMHMTARPRPIPDFNLYFHTLALAMLFLDAPTIWMRAVPVWRLSVAYPERNRTTRLHLYLDKLLHRRQLQLHRLQLQAPWPLASTLKAASVTSAPASSSKRTDFDCAIADTRREWWELFETNEC